MEHVGINVSGMYELEGIDKKKSKGKEGRAKDKAGGGYAHHLINVDNMD